MPQYSTFAIMYIGSRGSVSAAQPDQARKKDKDVQGQIQVENGDIVVVRTFEMELDLGLKSQGFGFCECRQRSKSPVTDSTMLCQTAWHVKSTHPPTPREKARGSPSLLTSAKNRS